MSYIYPYPNNINVRKKMSVKYKYLLGIHIFRNIFYFSLFFSEFFL